MQAERSRCTLVALLLASLAASAFPASADVAEIRISKDIVAGALNQALQGTEIHIDNYGAQNGTHWLEDSSYIQTPDGVRTGFPVPEYTYDLTDRRRFRYYVDDLNLADIQAGVDGNRIRLLLRFESEGEEIKGKCIRWAFFRQRWVECWLPIDRDFHLDDTGITVLAKPVAWDGSISYDDPTAQLETEIHFSTGLCAFAPRLCDHIRDRIERQLASRVEDAVRTRLEQRSVKAMVAASVRERLEALGLLRPSWRVTAVVSSGDDFLVTVDRTDVVDGGSVRSLVLIPEEPEQTATCPTTVSFLATIEMEEAAHGSGFLRYEDGSTSRAFSWSAGSGRTITSIVERPFEGRPGRTNRGWAEMTLEWKGTSGETFSITSNRADFSVRCSPGFNDTLRAPYVSGFYSQSLGAAGHENEEGLGLRFGLAVSPRFSLELGAARQSFETLTDASFDQASRRSRDQVTIDLGLAYRTPFQDRLNLLVLLGLGWRVTEGARSTSFGDPSGGIEEGSFAPSAGLGLDYSLGRGWHLQSRVLQRWIENDSEDPWRTELQTGVSYRFGG